MHDVSIHTIFASLRSSLFRFLSSKRKSREGSGTEVTRPPVPLFALAPCVRATSPWLSLSPAKRKLKRLLRRLHFCITSCLWERRGRVWGRLRWRRWGRRNSQARKGDGGCFELFILETGTYAQGYRGIFL